MYLTKTPFLLSKLYRPNDLWCIEGEGDDIYVTFDDGPVPEVTPWVLEQLDKYNAKATFFCVGDNVRKNKDIFSEIKKRGHSIGNHTFNHLNGWKSNRIDYVFNILKCRKHFHTDLFRPPYGKISFIQRNLIKKHFKLIYWTVLSGDFDPAITPETCLEKTISSTKKGSIVVFHDSIKAQKNLKAVLPGFLDHFHRKGYYFKAIPCDLKGSDNSALFTN
ncbi:MAG TPA: polysaccharide deacetylase family protein [Bacteroidales bacterium]|nr:polysaccharide deacetylase family protein [Bacteroidales bacterium]